MTSLNQPPETIVHTEQKLKRPLSAKIVHGIMVLAVIHQLTVAEWMVVPWDVRSSTSPIDIQLFQLHTLIGLLTLALVFAMLLGLWSRRKERDHAPLFQCWSSAERQQLIQEAKGAARQIKDMTLPASKSTQRLAHAVQGLGVLTILYMSATGFIIWILGDKSPWAESVANIHALGSGFIWAYLGGHAGMALIHQFSGERIFSKIFGSN